MTTALHCLRKYVDLGIANIMDAERLRSYSTITRLVSAATRAEARLLREQARQLVYERKRCRAERNAQLDSLSQNIL